MKKVLNVLVIIGLIPLLVLGASSIFAPTTMFERFGIQAINIMTYSTFRSNIGGSLLSAGLIMLLGLITKNRTWYQAALLMVSVILTTRIVSIIMDGWINELIPILFAECFNLIVLYFAAKQLNTTEK